MKKNSSFLKDRHTNSSHSVGTRGELEGSEPGERPGLGLRDEKQVRMKGSEQRVFLAESRIDEERTHTT